MASNDTISSVQDTPVRRDDLMCGLCHEIFSVAEYDEHMVDNHPDSLLADEDVSIIPSNNPDSPFSAPLPMLLEVKPDIANRTSSEKQPGSLKRKSTDDIPEEDHLFAENFVKVELLEDKGGKQLPRCKDYKILDFNCAHLGDPAGHTADLKTIFDNKHWRETTIQVNEVRSLRIQDGLSKDGFEYSYGAQISQITEDSISELGVQLTNPGEALKLKPTSMSMEQQSKDKLSDITADETDPIHIVTPVSHTRVTKEVIPNQSVGSIPFRTQQSCNPNSPHTYEHNHFHRSSSLDVDLARVPYPYSAAHYPVHPKRPMSIPQELTSCMYDSSKQRNHVQQNYGSVAQTQNQYQFHQPSCDPLMHGTKPNTQQNWQDAFTQGFPLQHTHSTIPSGASPNVNQPTTHFLTNNMNHVPDNMFIPSRNQAHSFPQPYTPDPTLQPPMEIRNRTYGSSCSQDVSQAALAGTARSTRHDDPYFPSHSYSTPQAPSTLPPYKKTSTHNPSLFYHSSHHFNSGQHQTNNGNYAPRTRDMKPNFESHEANEEDFLYSLQDPKITCDLCAPLEKVSKKFYNKDQILRHQKEVHNTEVNLCSEWCRGCGKKYIRGSGDARIKHEAKCNGFAMLPTASANKRQRVRKLMT